MKKYALIFICLLVLLPITLKIEAQSCDLLYFCEEYDATDGEIGCNDRYYAGNLTVVTLLSSPIYYTKVTVQLDKFDPKSNDFEYYNDWEFDVESDMDYIYFENIYFGDPGFYRVFLLDPYRQTIVSALVEII